MNVKKKNRVMILDLTIYNSRMFNWENNPLLNKLNVTGTEDMPNSMPRPLVYVTSLATAQRLMYCMHFSIKMPRVA